MCTYDCYTQAPRQYLRAWEQSFRRTAKAGTLFPKKAARSKKEYQSVVMWRKQECYITACRAMMKCSNYKSWSKFVWKDYVERLKLVRTFQKRHLPCR